MPTKLPFDPKRPNWSIVRQIMFNRLRADPAWKQMEQTGEYFDPYVDYEGSDPKQARDPNALMFAVHEMFWQLVVDGILAPGMNPANPNLPWFHVTGYGRHVLEQGEYQPYDPDQYMERLQTRLGGSPDATVSAYLVEALQTFRRRSLIGSMVLLGVAAERVFILLCEAMAAALQSAKEQAKLADALKRQSMKPRLDWMHSKIQQLQDAKKIPDNSTLMIDAVYDLIRIQRNELGHPRDTPPHVDVEEAFANLTIFPRYYETAENVRHFLLTNKV